MLKLISLNIEGDKHFARNIPFLESETADVVCLQEVFEEDLQFLASMIGAIDFIFCPMRLRSKKTENIPRVQRWGIAIFSKLPISLKNQSYYCLSADELSQEDTPESAAKAIASIKVEKDQESFFISTTHFTWTPDGTPTPLQLNDLKLLLNILKQMPEVILCGDFNAPRGGPVFDQIAEIYKDNIPTSVESSLDPILHRLRDTRKLMVDGLFTSNHYQVEDAQVINGVSDHCAIVAQIKRA